MVSKSFDYGHITPVHSNITLFKAVLSTTRFSQIYLSMNKSKDHKIPSFADIYVLPDSS